MKALLHSGQGHYQAHVLGKPKKRLRRRLMNSVFKWKQSFREKARRAFEQNNMAFIKTSCSATTYPRLCFTSLSTRASAIQTSPKLLAQTALSVTLNTTLSTSATMFRLAQTRGMSHREVAAMRDCIEVLNDSIYSLRRSVGEMSQPGSKDFRLVMNDVQTWVSAALTDEDTCSDGFSGDPKMKYVVRGKIVNVSHLTSNALALVNNYASLSPRVVQSSTKH